jgi:hypothetical protein
VGEARLSLAAELLWLSINPSHGGLLAPKPRRLRRALAAARASDEAAGSVGPGRGRHAAGAARRELVAAGLVKPGRLLRNIELTDRAPAGRRFRALWERVEAKQPLDERDGQLALLLASAGVLTARLSPHDREIAWRRLKAAFPQDDSGTWRAPASGTASPPRWGPALGKVALRGWETLAAAALNDLAASIAPHFGTHHAQDHSAGLHHGGGYGGGNGGGGGDSANPGW